MVERTAKRKSALRTCSRGHQFYKSSDCPVCPKCWAGYYRTRFKNDLPRKLSAPALRALLNAKITSLKKLSTKTEKEILSLHGIGPASIPLLKSALKSKGLTLK